MPRLKRSKLTAEKSVRHETVLWGRRNTGLVQKGGSRAATPPYGVLAAGARVRAPGSPLRGLPAPCCFPAPPVPASGLRLAASAFSFPRFPRSASDRFPRLPPPASALRLPPSASAGFPVDPLPVNDT